MSEVTAHVTAQAVATRAEETLNKASLGFWIYLMSDCVLFAGLFATYAVLHVNTFGGPGPAQLFHLPLVLIETLVLLGSSYSTGIAIQRAHRQEKILALFWLAVTFVLGVIFLSIELSEFRDLAASGNSWTRSGFLSAFFTLVGTHGAHITLGLVWLATMIVQIFVKGLTSQVLRRLTLFSLFWHFLDVVWIFIFTTVYLLGVG